METMKDNYSHVDPALKTSPPPHHNTLPQNSNVMYVCQVPCLYICINNTTLSDKHIRIIYIIKLANTNNVNILETHNNLISKVEYWLTVFRINQISSLIRKEILSFASHKIVINIKKIKLSIHVIKIIKKWTEK